MWGGGIYPDDWFYELCDEYGIIVWQDLMFACSMYDADEAFVDSISQEVRDNVRRIRHHACLGLWCGNNEIEQMWDSWDIPCKQEKLKNDYLKIFEQLLPGIVKEEDPQTFYWPSSPSSGGGFAEPNGEAAGDAHSWDVWHGLAPFTDYRKHVYRFVSEFGFQSFPPMETINSFTLPKDRNIFSYVMEKHQKNKAANGKILYYLSDNFKYSKDLESLVYSSQLLQAEAMKCGVEHWRRNRGHCMGTLYWQLNDCWPVASWSGIDCYGRWKALHYFARRFYVPVLISACDEGADISLHVTNDTLKSFSGTARWSLRDAQGGIMQSGEAEADVPALNAERVVTLDFADKLKDGSSKRNIYFEYRLEEDDEVIGRGTVLFTRAKHFEFPKPKITVRVEEQENCFAIAVKSDVFAKYVEISMESIDCVFSDNYFDLLPGEEYTVYLDKAEYPDISLGNLRSKLRVRSITDIA
jgi:beta-mannosidase